mmetsp:Transcript_30997/g.82372  ORF Transcript_30997/g.82372 Transcript_30997/m.82372 type:complete len:329 (+) Transcript_30997:1053-2039(+)
MGNCSCASARIWLAVGVKNPSITTNRCIDGKLTSLVAFTPSVMSFSRPHSCSLLTSWPPIVRCFRFCSTDLRNNATRGSNSGRPIIGTGKNDLDGNASLMTSLISLLPSSGKSASSNFSKAVSSYLNMFLFTTKMRCCSGIFEFSSTRINDFAASDAERFCNEASDAIPDTTNTTSVHTAKPKTLTRVRMAAIALLPPSQSMTKRCSPSPAGATPSASVPHSARRRSTDCTAMSMPSVTGSAESLETKASSRHKTLDARYDLPPRPSPMKITGVMTPGKVLINSKPSDANSAASSGNFNRGTDCGMAPRRKGGQNGQETPTWGYIKVS